MITISKEQLKKKLYEYFYTVEQTGEELIVTNNKIPIIKIVPINNKKKEVIDVFADIRGKIEYHEDILTPEIEEWEEV